MTQPKPFSPEMLAERWDCSAETVRNLIRDVGYRQVMPMNCCLVGDDQEVATK